MEVLFAVVSDEDVDQSHQVLVVQSHLIVVDKHVVEHVRHDRGGLGYHFQVLD